MPHHTNNNPGNMGWKEQLDDTAYFSPGEKDQAWNKLQDRLQQRKKKRAGWYWLAAACMLVVVGSLLIRIGVQEQLPAAASSIAASPDKSTVEVTDSKPGLAPVNMNQPLVVSPAHQGNMKLSNLPVAPVPVLFNKPAETVLVQPTAVPADVQQQISLVRTTMDSGSAKLVAAVPAKQRLSVVHINELDEPMPNTFKRPTSIDYSVIQFRITPQPTNDIHSPTTLGISFSTGKSSPAN